VLCAGAISLGLGMLAFCHDIRAASQLAAAIGALLLGFTAWLLWGLHGMLRQPETLMLVPRSGPGLFVVFAGAVLIMCAGIAGVRGGRSNAH
jgi:hypothetical protein